MTGKVDDQLKSREQQDYGDNSRGRGRRLLQEIWEVGDARAGGGGETESKGRKVSRRVTAKRGDRVGGRINMRQETAMGQGVGGG